MSFPGQYYDSETGLHYNWNRYYDPSTGRYLTPDPIGLVGGVNLYVYSNSNPINLTDIYGLAPSSFTCDEQELCKEVCRNRGGVAACVHSETGFFGISATACKCKDDEKCEQQAQQDEAICRGLKDPAARARCWANANDRYGACKAGRSLPPLVTW